MKIIEEGSPYQGKCSKCGCKIECNKFECTQSKDKYTHRCPKCPATISMTRKREVMVEDLDLSAFRREPTLWEEICDFF